MRPQAAFMVSVRRNFVSTQVESQNKSKGTCFKIRRRGCAAIDEKYCERRRRLFDIKHFNVF